MRQIATVEDLVAVIAACLALIGPAPRELVTEAEGDALLASLGALAMPEHYRTQLEYRFRADMAYSHDVQTRLALSDAELTALRAGLGELLYDPTRSLPGPRLTDET